MDFILITWTNRNAVKIFGTRLLKKTDYSGIKIGNLTDLCSLMYSCVHLRINSPPNK
jgi:hypothetical protein